MSGSASVLYHIFILILALCRESPKHFHVHSPTLSRCSLTGTVAVPHLHCSPGSSPPCASPVPVHTATLTEFFHAFILMSDTQKLLQEGVVISFYSKDPWAVIKGQVMLKTQCGHRGRGTDKGIR